MFRRLFGGGGKHRKNDDRSECPGSPDGSHHISIWSDTTRSKRWEECDHCPYRADLKF